ncbi:hypothetical protein WMF30_17785 [Sorangium sp. So ce134]
MLTGIGIRHVPHAVSTFTATLIMLLLSPPLRLSRSSAGAPPRSSAEGTPGRTLPQ